MAKKTQADDSPEQTAKKKVTHLEKAIEDATGDFERLTSQIWSQIEKKEGSVRDELGEVNADIAKLRQGLGTRAAQLRDEVHGSIERTRRKVEDLEIVCYVIAGIFVLMYLSLLIAYKIPIVFETLTPAAAAFIVAFFVGYSARIAKRDIFSETYTVNQYIADIWSQIS